VFKAAQNSTRSPRIRGRNVTTCCFFCLTYMFRYLHRLFICTLINKAALRKSNASLQRHVGCVASGELTWTTLSPPHPVVMPAHFPPAISDPYYLYLHSGMVEHATPLQGKVSLTSAQMALLMLTFEADQISDICPKLWTKFSRIR